MYSLKNICSLINRKLTNFEEQDLLIISIEYPNPRLCLATGRLLEISNENIKVIVDR